LIDFFAVGFTDSSHTRMEFGFEALPSVLAVPVEGVVYPLRWYRISASDSFASRSRVLCTFFGRVMGSDVQTATLDGLE
jgi:hypothetical protein